MNCRWASASCFHRFRLPWKTWSIWLPSCSTWSYEVSFCSFEKWCACHRKSKDFFPCAIPQWLGDMWSGILFDMASDLWFGLAIIHGRLLSQIFQILVINPVLMQSDLSLVGKCLLIWGYERFPYFPQGIKVVCSYNCVIMIPISSLYNALVFLYDMFFSYIIKDI